MSLIKLVQMKAISKGTVFLHASQYDNTWTCIAEGANDGMAYKVEGKGSVPSEAIDNCYSRFTKITDALPEITGRLSPPQPEPAHDGDSMMDDIPF